MGDSSGHDKLFFFFCWLPLIGPITFQRLAAFFANGSFFDMYFLSCPFGLKTKSHFFLSFPTENQPYGDTLEERYCWGNSLLIYWCLNPYHDCSNLQHQVYVGARDEKLKSFSLMHYPHFFTLCVWVDRCSQSDGWEQCVSSRAVVWAVGLREGGHCRRTRSTVILLQKRV